MNQYTLMKNIQLLALISLFSYINHLECQDNSTKQEEYLAQFETAKKDTYFCSFVNSFIEKSATTSENSGYELPLRHLVCCDLYKKEKSRMQRVMDKAEYNASLKDRYSNNDVKVFAEALTAFASWFEYRSVDKEIEKIRTLKAVQEQVRSDLTRLRPVYQRCKKLSAEDQEKCLETVKLDLYNLYTNYFKQERTLFPKGK